MYKSVIQSCTFGQFLFCSVYQLNSKLHARRITIILFGKTFYNCIFCHHCYWWQMNFSPDFDSILHNNNADCTAMAVLICYKPDFSSKESAVDTHTKKNTAIILADGLQWAIYEDKTSIDFLTVLLGLWISCFLFLICTGGRE